MQMNLMKEKADQGIAWVQERRITEAHKQLWRVKDVFAIPSYGGGSVSAYICQNSSNFTL